MILLFIFWVPFYPPLGARYIILLISLDYLWYKIRITLHSTYRVRILSGTMFFIFTFNVLSILGPRSVRSIWCCRCFSNEIRYQFVLCDKNIIIEVPIKLHCACWRFYMFLICILYLYWMSGGGHRTCFWVFEMIICGPNYCCLRWKFETWRTFAVNLKFYFK